MGTEVRRTAGSDRAGPGVMLVLLGLAPWVWLAGAAILTEVLKRATRNEIPAVMMGIGALALVGALSLVVALLAGLVSHVRYRRRRRADLLRAEDAPARVDRPELVTKLARFAGAIGVVIVGGGFAAAVIAPLTPYDGWSDKIDANPNPISYAMIAVTLVALVGGVRLLRRSRI
jgi:hypothetical protein